MKHGSILPIVALVVAAVVVGAALLFAFPYKPTQPPRVNAVNATEKGIRTVVNDTNTFAVSMYHELENSRGNVFFSPYSIYSAMAIVYEGAEGNTEKQLQEKIPFPEKAILEPNFAAIYNRINNASKDYTLRTGNALWIQKGFPINSNYQQRVEEYYGAKAALVDFKNQPVKSVQTINDFISKQTNGRIPEILDPTDPAVRDYKLVITNAIYFKGTWKYKFNPKDTKEQNFYVSKDKTVKVQMMHMYPEHTEFNYADLGFAQVLELPYKGELSMVIILPNKTNTTIQDVENRMTPKTLDTWLSSMHENSHFDVIAIPKFEFMTSYSLNKNFMDMGITDLFSDAADLKGISSKPLKVDEIIHKAYVKVDEEGTEAAAATAVTVGLTAVAPRYHVDFVADHPFIFLIRDNKTGAILFMGKVVDPSESK